MRWGSHAEGQVYYDPILKLRIAYLSKEERREYFEQRVKWMSDSSTEEWWTEDGDIEEFVEEDLELLDELIEGRNMDINGLCHPRMFQSHLLQSLSLSDSHQRDDGGWLQRRFLIDHSSSN